jgi:hypothetical protein
MPNIQRGHKLIRSDKIRDGIEPEKAALKFKRAPYEVEK